MAPDSLAMTAEPTSRRGEEPNFWLDNTVLRKCGCKRGSRKSPPGKRKLLTAKQTLHCGTVLVVTTLRGADGSCKVLPVVMEVCRDQPRLQCGTVAAALLSQFSRFCTENNAIADVAHWPSHNPVAEASVGRHCTTVAEPDSISIHGFDDKHLQFPLFACRLAFVPINPYYRLVCDCPRLLRLCKRLMLIDSETLLSPDTRRC